MIAYTCVKEHDVTVLEMDTELYNNKEYKSIEKEVRRLAASRIAGTSPTLSRLTQRALPSAKSCT